MANYLDNLRDIVDEADKRIRSRTIPKKRGPGKPETNPADIAKTLLLQTYTGSPNRIAEGLLLLFREKLGISEHFSYKTIERGYDREKVNKILDEVVAITNECVENEKKPVHLMEPVIVLRTKKTMLINNKSKIQKRIRRNPSLQIMIKVMIVFQ